LNADKMQFRQKEVTCLDHVVSSEGLGGDPSKLRAINDIPARKDKPRCVHLRVLGMVNYLKKFSPELADLVKPLRELVKKDGYPETYAARSLTAIEVSYAQIEKKKLFSIAFSIEGFEGYFCGRKVFIQTDHKPLESIMFKSLLTAPKRL